MTDDELLARARAWAAANDSGIGVEFDSAHVLTSALTDEKAWRVDWHYDVDPERRYAAIVPPDAEALDAFLAYHIGAHAPR